MVVLIQKRCVDTQSLVDSQNMRQYGILPPYKTIYEGKRVFWTSWKQLREWCLIEYGAGQYLVRICNGGKGALYIKKIVVNP